MADVRQGEAQVGTNAEDRSAWVRRHLADSVYLWACGEKAEHDKDDPEISDRLIGWLVLLVQGFAYAMLLVLAGLAVTPEFVSDGGESTPYSDEFTNYSGYFSGGGGSRESRHLLAAITGAIYLLVASTTHDLRAGYSLLVDGSCAGHRAFGISLLIVYGIMMSAAMKVLMSTSEDSASVVLNAVTVIFIADLDEKALKFLSTVRHRWRLFWAIYPIGISFVLALVAVVHIDGSSLPSQNTKWSVNSYPDWILWVLNPLAVTIFSYLLSSCLQRVCESCSEASENVGQRTFSFFVVRAFVGILATIKRAKHTIREDPFFYAALILWVVQGVVGWGFYVFNFSMPLAIDTVWDIFASGWYLGYAVHNTGVLVFANVMLASGFTMKALGIWQSGHQRVIANPEPRLLSGGNEARDSCGSCADSRVASMLVGWGIGYWVTSLLVVVGMGWSRYGLYEAPAGLSFVTCVFMPSFTFAAIFIAADPNVLGEIVGAFIKPAVERIRDKHGVVYWILVSVFRDVLIFWMILGYFEIAYL